MSIKKCFFLVCLLTSLSLSTVFAQAPKLSLKDSLKIAEEAVDKTELDIKNFYIFSIMYTNSSKGDFWYYTFRAVTPSEYNEVFAKVYMDGSVDLSGGALSQNKRY